MYKHKYIIYATQLFTNSVTMQVATVFYSLVPLQHPIHGLHMGRKLRTILALFNTTPKVLSSDKKNFE